MGAHKTLPGTPSGRGPAGKEGLLSRRIHPWILLLGFLSLLAVVSLLGQGGLPRIWRMWQESRTLQREIQALEAENEELGRQIDRLRSDPAMIEKIAREELNMVRPDERVYRFPSQPGKAGSPWPQGDVLPVP